MLVDLAHLAAQSKATTEVGGIRGQVVDGQTGKPVAKARVVAEPDDNSQTPQTGKVNTVITDEQGEFAFEGLKPGQYVIAAAKEEDGYPNTDFAPFALNLADLPKVVVRSGELVENILVKAYRGGRLAGEILDSSTKQPVLTSRIRLSRVDDPHLWLTTGPDINGRFQFTLPDRPFRVEVTAPGYQAWIFGENGTQILKLERDSEKKLQIVLQKE